ncbi:MAG: hypothetical protein JJW01_00915 [Alphaproteobacteria bacterium]|nr:hypothetical protein [Rickettsiales bacterium]
MNNPSAGSSLSSSPSSGAAINTALSGQSLEVAGIDGTPIWGGQIFDIPIASYEPIQKLGAMADKKFGLADVISSKIGGIKVQSISAGTGVGSAKAKTIF